jgi:hypothetical protein
MHILGSGFSEVTLMGQMLEEMVLRIRAEEPELRRRGIRHLAVFGSVARGDDRPDSDVDIAVDIEPGHPFSLIRMEDTRLLLEDALGRAVDLGEIETFRPQVRQAFERDQVQVF